jgi:hypothetical protein
MAVQGELSIQAGPQVTNTGGDDQRADQAADREVGHAGLEPRTGVAAGQPADAEGTVRPVELGTAARSARSR